MRRFEIFYILLGMNSLNYQTGRFSRTVPRIDHFHVATNTTDGCEKNGHHGHCSKAVLIFE